MTKRVEVFAPRGARMSGGPGHVFVLAPGERKSIPDYMLAEAYKQGCIPTDSVRTEVAPILDAPPGPELLPVEAPQGDARIDQIRIAIEAVMNDPNEKARTGAGRPRVNLVKGLLDFDTTADEVNGVYDLLYGEGSD